MFEESAKEQAKAPVTKFKVGTRVRVARKPETIHGEPDWVEEMDKEIGKVITISNIMHDHIYAVSENSWEWNEDWLVDADEASFFEIGDYVVVNASIDERHINPHIGWHGKVIGIECNSFLVVHNDFTDESYCLTPFRVDLIERGSGQAR